MANGGIIGPDNIPYISKNVTSFTSTTPGGHTFHPGTTDTGLSQPFQAAVPSGKLFTPAFVATRLSGIMDNAALDGGLSYIDWNGQPIPW